MRLCWAQGLLACAPMAWAQPAPTTVSPTASAAGSGGTGDHHPVRTQWLPGALADHLTSHGGNLSATERQMSTLDWLESGATASDGTVSEPCNHLQKIPHLHVLLLHYLRGATGIEACWRSVAGPGQGVLVGEPVATPF